MIPLYYFIATSLALIGIAIAGIIADRHFIVIMLAVELIFLASTIAIVSFISYQVSPDPNSVLMLVSIWGVAAAEIITVVTFYIYMKYRGMDFDVSKLSKMKW